MKCEKCGFELKASDNFCQSCGAEAKSIGLYIKDWKRGGVILSGARCDIYFDNSKLNVIKLKNFNGETVGGLLGLGILNIIGLFLGGLIGRRRDDRKREEFRSVWVNDTNRIVSDEYKKHILVEVPVSEIRQSLEFKTKKIVIYYKNKKFTFSNSKSNVELLSKYVNDYVL